MVAGERRRQCRVAFASAGEGMAAALGSQDPAPTGADLAWQQDQLRGVFEDAAHLADQPRGW